MQKIQNNEENKKRIKRKKWKKNRNRAKTSPSARPSQTAKQAQ
jgi:hypothetical protein